MLIDYTRFILGDSRKCRVALIVPKHPQLAYGAFATVRNGAWRGAPLRTTQPNGLPNIAHLVLRTSEIYQRRGVRQTEDGSIYCVMLRPSPAKFSAALMVK
jgi:hypothetical protein